MDEFIKLDCVKSTWDNCNYRFVRKEEKEKKKLVSASIDKRDLRSWAEKLNWLSKVAPESHTFFFCRPDKNPTSYFVLSILKPSVQPLVHLALNSARELLFRPQRRSEKRTAASISRFISRSLFLSLARVLSLFRAINIPQYILQRQYINFLYIYLYI